MRAEATSDLIEFGVFGVIEFLDIDLAKSLVCNLALGSC